MNRRRADAVVGGIVGLVLLAGTTLTWEAYRQRRALDGSMGSMMDSSMGSMHGPNPLWPLLGTLVVVVVIAGAYLVLRSEVTASTDGTRFGPDEARSGGVPDAGSEDTQGAAGTIEAGAQPRARVLDLLPEDERRILEPVLKSPGVTQIELRDRSGFSKSKVSQTASALEKRGLLYRERQGRTYRIYPSEDLEG